MHKMGSSQLRPTTKAKDYLFDVRSMKKHLQETSTKEQAKFTRVKMEQDYGERMRGPGRYQVAAERRVSCFVPHQGRYENPMFRWSQAFEKTSQTTPGPATYNSRQKTVFQDSLDQIRKSAGECQGDIPRLSSNSSRLPGPGLYDPQRTLDYLHARPQSAMINTTSRFKATRMDSRACQPVGQPLEKYERSKQMMQPREPAFTVMSSERKLLLEDRRHVMSAAVYSADIDRFGRPCSVQQYARSLSGKGNV